MFVRGIFQMFNQLKKNVFVSGEVAATNLLSNIDYIPIFES